jgi:hypothetical protein
MLASRSSIATKSRFISFPIAPFSRVLPVRAGSSQSMQQIYRVLLDDQRRE